MHGCARFTPLLEGYLDGELSAEQIDAVEEHLWSCPRCQKELEELCTLRKILREAMEEGLVNEQLQVAWDRITEGLTPPTLKERIWWPVRNLLPPFRPLRTLAWGLALLVILLFIIPLVTTAPSPPVEVESIESEHPVMIFQGEEGMTVIWLFEAEE